MGGQAAEQIIAGVVLSERLAVTMYGAVHRAQFQGQRNLRGIVVEPKLLAENAFRIALTDAKNIAAVTKLAHPNIVPTVGVEAGGAEVVVVTRGGGRYVSVQDLITSSKARSKQAGKLPVPIAGAIGKAVIEALAAAHKAGLIHGAVHPSSVLVDEDGNVRLDDFVVGRALTIAVAQGAESSLWRGLAGYIAPELVVGEDPTPPADVFAVGAMLFTMLSGEAPPGALRSTPAVERLVQRALDTDMSRRYKTAADLLENLLEAMEDDRWELADKRELIQEAGLSAIDGAGIDDATEDLLASLGAPTGIQMQTVRPSADLRAQQMAAKRPASDKGGLDSLLADLGDDASGLTQVDDIPRGRGRSQRDPISEVIRRDRVPSLDDPDETDATPLPPPQRDSHLDMHQDENAAMNAIAGLDVGARRMSTAGEQATAAAEKLEQAAQRAERAAKRLESSPHIVAEAPPPRARPAMPVMPPPDMSDLPTPRLKSPLRGVIGGLVVLGVLGGAGYMLYTKFTDDQAKSDAAKAQRADDEKKKKELEDKLRNGQPDPGALDVTAQEAGVWLRLGRTPLDTSIHLQAGQPHDLVLLHDGQDMTEAQVNGPSWSGAKEQLKATLTVPMKPLPAKAKKPAELPLQPTTPVLASTGVVGAGVVHVESIPSDAEVWLFLGANHARITDVFAGRDYELAVVRPGYKTQHVSFKAEDWRDGGDPNVPIDAAKKKAELSKTVELEKDK